MSTSKPKYDWQEVVDLKPRGDFEFQGHGNTIVRGPIKKLTITEFDSVLIELKWAAEMPTMGEEGFGTWKASDKRVFSFPNLVLPYVIETTPEKGDRIRFGVSILFVKRLEGVNTLDVTKINGLTCATHVAPSTNGPCAEGSVSLRCICRDPDGRQWAQGLADTTASPSQIEDAVRRGEILKLKEPMYLTATQQFYLTPDGRTVVSDINATKPPEEIGEEVEFEEAPA